MFSHKKVYALGGDIVANIVKQIVYDDGGGRFGGVVKHNCK